MGKKLNLLLFKEDGWWVAQCLNYDIAAQARTMPDAQYEIQRMIVGRVMMADKLGIDPFEGLQEAPAEYHIMAKDSEKSFKVELKHMKHLPRKRLSDFFKIPKQALLYAA